MGSAFHQLCPRYSGSLTPTAPSKHVFKEKWSCLTILDIPDLLPEALKNHFSYVFVEIAVVAPLLKPFSFYISGSECCTEARSRD